MVLTFLSIEELVKVEKNGLLFSSSSELANQLLVGYFESCQVLEFLKIFTWLSFLTTIISKLRVGTSQMHFSIKSIIFPSKLRKKCMKHYIHLLN